MPSSNYATGYLEKRLCPPNYTKVGSSQPKNKVKQNACWNFDPVTCVQQLVLERMQTALPHWCLKRGGSAFSGFDKIADVMDQ